MMPMDEGDLCMLFELSLGGRNDGVLAEVGRSDSHAASKGTELIKLPRFVSDVK